jgi:pSer/pThr/pTyr-binding forkhead associated (FHA) protein
MSVLRNLESKLAGLVEGTFGRAFRAEVRPEELARRLAKEMDEHRTVSLSRTYAPHEYVVHLSPDDLGRFAGIERAVCDELSAYLLEHARAERLALVATPVIELRSDERLGLGEFGIETRQAPPPQPEPADEPAPRAPAPRAPAQSDRRPRTPPAAARAFLTAEGRRFVVAPEGTIVGRSRECDVVLDDSNISRRHARIALEGGEWTIEDLGSTNGVQVNGARAKSRTALHPGDRLDLGTVSARFEVD